MKKQKDGKNKFFTLNHEVQVVTDVSQVVIHNCRGIIKLFLYLSTMFHNVTRKLIRNFQWLKNQNKKSVPSKKNKSSRFFIPTVINTTDTFDIYLIMTFLTYMQILYFELKFRCVWTSVCLSSRIGE